MKIDKNRRNMSLVNTDKTDKITLCIYKNVTSKIVEIDEIDNTEQNR